MRSSPPPDSNAWRDQSWRPGPGSPRGPRRPKRLKHPWITAVLVIFGLLLGLGGLGALIEKDQERTSGTASPSQTSATQAPDEPHHNSPGAMTQPPAETSDDPTASPSQTSATQAPDEPHHNSPRAMTQPPAETSDDPTATPTQKTKPPSTAPSTVMVLRIIDGDTLEVRGDGRVLPKGAVARVRLLEIDTPERGACFADDATARTATLLPPGSRIRAERDAELTDPYDRYLLYVWNEQGTFVNESLVRSGHAKAVLFPPNDKYWPKISDAEDAAQQVGAGLWTACPEQPETSIAPPDPPESPATDTPARSGLPDGPPAGVPDVDCPDLSGPVWVGPDDPHRLDRNGDGIGCEVN